MSSIREVNIQGGSAHATSSHPAPWTPDKAFSVGHNNAWHNNRGTFPSMVWYQFPAGATFIPARVSFRSRQDCCQDEGPSMWQFVGSNDENCGKNGDWTVLCEDLSDVGFRSKAYTKYTCMVCHWYAGNNAVLNDNEAKRSPLKIVIYNADNI